MSRLTESELFEQYIPFNKAVPYKEFMIHPIRICDFYSVQDILGVLEIDKNILGQIEFISMSNLRFILYLAHSEEKYQKQLDVLLRKSLNIPDDYEIQFYINDKTENLQIGKVLNTIHGHAILDDSTSMFISANDFDEIRRVILYQNVLDYTDKYIDPDVRKAVDDYYRLKNKDAKNVPLEHKVICVQLKTGMSIESIGNLTIRNFLQLFSIIVEESEYTALRFAECNGVKFKSPIEHWAYKVRKDKYSEAFCDADSFISEVQSAN